MKQASRFNVHPGWKILLKDIGINPSELLALARLPADMFSRKDATLSVDEYFNIWNGLEKLTDASELPLLIGQAISVETFDPPVFASFCSPDLNTALQRLCKFKRLIGPMILGIDINSKSTSACISVYQHTGDIPRSLGIMETVYLTKLARMATRQKIIPKAVILSKLPDNIGPYQEFYGITPQAGDINMISFSAADAERPFITENERMWEYFEPELKKRLSDLDKEASTTQRVKSVLLEMLPGGQTSMEEAATRLTMSKRTLQRRLNNEGQNFKLILQTTREELARHYLSNSTMSQGEISFLLGFQDTNSFIRAYSTWTGTSPGQYRSMH